jgi:HD-GYP domain-containing protein (c-di-GMP phosphodiesterase class II)
MSQTVISRHPDEGYRMLAGQGFGPEMLAVVRSHHEMLDGSGMSSAFSRSG